MWVCFWLAGILPQAAFVLFVHEQGPQRRKQMALYKAAVVVEGTLLHCSVFLYFYVRCKSMILILCSWFILTKQFLGALHRNLHRERLMFLQPVGDELAAFTDTGPPKILSTQELQCFWTIHELILAPFDHFIHKSEQFSHVTSLAWVWKCRWCTMAFWKHCCQVVCSIGCMNGLFLCAKVVLSNVWVSL